MNKKKRKKTSHAVSPECADLHQTTELWWVNLRMQLFVASIYDQMEEEFSNRLRQLYSRKYTEFSKYQLIFVTAEEVLTAEKSTASPFHLSSLRGFYFNFLSIFFFVIGKYFRSLN